MAETGRALSLSVGVLGETGGGETLHATLLKRITLSCCEQDFRDDAALCYGCLRLLYIKEDLVFSVNLFSLSCVRYFG